MISISLLAIILFAFFGSSLPFGDKITYTDQVAITIPTITFIDPVLGKADAKVTIVVFSDYGCKSCASLDKTMVSLVTNSFPNDLRVVWKDMPNTSQHKEALNAAIAARCAGDQNQFWQYHTLLMTNQASLKAALYTSLADQLKLKSDVFSTCLINKTPVPIIQQTHEEGIALGISATPTFFINGSRHTGSVDEGTLKTMIRQAIANVK